jgi:hypothetical protein
VTWEFNKIQYDLKHWRDTLRWPDGVLTDSDWLSTGYHQNINIYIFP